MESFDGNTIFLEPRLPSIRKTHSAGTQTDPLKTTDTSTDPIPKIDESVQIDCLIKAGTLSEKIYISETVVNQFIKCLQLNIKENSVLKKLNALHTANQIAFLHKKQLELLQAEEFSVLNVESNGRDVVAVSFGIRNHDSWCSHNAKVILVHDKQTNYILLPCCPTTVRFGPHRTLFIAGQNGTIYYTVDGQIRSAVELHNLCITGLVWFTSQLLISCSLDGYICISAWDGISLKQQRLLPITIADLPRKLRGSNHSDKTTG